MIACLTAALFAVGVAGIANAQGITASGTDFWAGFFPNGDFGDMTLTEMFLASTAADTALVTFDGVTSAYPLAADSVLTIDLQSRGITDIPETPLDRSVHIQTHAPISVYGFYDSYARYASGSGGSPDGFLGLPTTSLGTEYYTVNYTEWDQLFGDASAEFLVIAPYDSTVVTITTKAHTRNSTGGISHAPGDTWSVMLMKGQSYLVQSSGAFSGIDDLTGSHVLGSKPIALLTGHQIANIPLSMYSADYLIEMEPSVDRWGTEYFEMPMAGRTICGDYIRILSAEDGNSITANGTPIATLNAGQWKEIPTVTTPQYYASANGRRFIVAQYSYSAHYLGDPAAADPFLVLLTSREEFERRIFFRTPDPAQGASYANYLTILAPLNSMSAITINGMPATSYTSVGQAVFPGTTIGALRILLPDGSRSYLATSNVLFGMYQYGISDYEGYGWPAGRALNLRTADTIAPAETFVKRCGDYDVTLSETRTLPAYSFTDSRIAEVTMITQPGDPRWTKPSFNYGFALDPAFRPGDSIARFSLTAIDPSKPAYAAIYTVDFDGNDTVYEYSNDSLAQAPGVQLVASSNASRVFIDAGNQLHLY
ncbi:MAG: IgGFc-binding protein, partial [Candidatus Kapaibacterium sp.]